MAWTGVGSGSLNMGVGSGNSLSVDIVSASVVLLGSLLNITSLSISSAASAGSGGALPGTVAGYFKGTLLPAGTAIKFPYYFA